MSDWNPLSARFGESECPACGEPDGRGVLNFRSHCHTCFTTIGDVEREERLVPFVGVVVFSVLAAGIITLALAWWNGVQYAAIGAVLTAVGWVMARSAGMTGEFLPAVRDGWGGR